MKNKIYYTQSFQRLKEEDVTALLQNPRLLAIALLNNSLFRVIRMAAVIHDVHGVIAYGWNKECVGGTIHAEEMALANADPTRLSGATITVAGLRFSKRQTREQKAPSLSSVRAKVHRVAERARYYAF